MVMIIFVTLLGMTREEAEKDIFRLRKSHIEQAFGTLPPSEVLVPVGLNLSEKPFAACVKELLVLSFMGKKEELVVAFFVTRKYIGELNNMLFKYSKSGAVVLLEKEEGTFEFDLLGYL
jgi:hypothetical protein